MMTLMQNKPAGFIMDGDLVYTSSFQPTGESSDGVFPVS